MQSTSSTSENWALATSKHALPHLLVDRHLHRVEVQRVETSSLAKIIRRRPAMSRRETAGVPCSAPAVTSEAEEHLQKYVPQHALPAVARAGEVRPRPLTGAVLVAGANVPARRPPRSHAVPPAGCEVGDFSCRARHSGCCLVQRCCAHQQG